MPADRRVILLGPQRLAPTLADAVTSLDLDPQARIAAVTAGWEDREHDDAELSDHLGGRVINLRIFERAEDVYHRDSELHQAMRQRHDTLRKLQRIYASRLDHALAAARSLMARQDDEALIAPERADAIAAVRALDRHHFERVNEIHAEFEEQWHPSQRDAAARHKTELQQVLDDTGALCIAGGHVAILLNRMRLFDLTALTADPVIAWSAGAMAISDRVVLFHDRPPQGEGNAELLVPGLGLAPDVVALPHAARRLRLDDTDRVALLAQRFTPAACIALDDNARMDWDGSAWTAQSGTQALSQDGVVRDVRAA